LYWDGEDGQCLTITITEIDLRPDSPWTDYAVEMVIAVLDETIKSIDVHWAGLPQLVFRLVTGMGWCSIVVRL